MIEVLNLEKSDIQLTFTIWYEAKIHTEIYVSILPQRHTNRLRIN